jgi:hypothetical protein
VPTPRCSSKLSPWPRCSARSGALGVPLRCPRRPFGGSSSVAGVNPDSRHLRFLRRWARASGGIVDALGLDGRARPGGRRPVRLALTLPLDYSADADEGGRLTAMTFFVGYVVAAVGPVAVGAQRDATGGYAVPFVALAALGVAMLVASFQFRPRSASSSRGVYIRLRRGCLC